MATVGVKGLKNIVLHVLVRLSYGFRDSLQLQNVDIQTSLHLTIMCNLEFVIKNVAF